MNGKEPFRWDRRHLPSAHPGSLNLVPAFPITTCSVNNRRRGTLGQPRQCAVGEASDCLPPFRLFLLACERTTGCVGLKLSLLTRIDVVLLFAYRF